MTHREHVRERIGMYLNSAGTYDGWAVRNWNYLFYCVLHSFGNLASDADTIHIDLEDGEFTFTANGMVYFEEVFWFYPALMSSFSVTQTQEKTVVKFKPDPEIWPNMLFDEQYLVHIMEDYAYLHSSHTIIFRGQSIKGCLKDLFEKKYGAKGEILEANKERVTIILAQTGTGDVRILDYVGGMRTGGGRHAYALKKAVKEHFPQIAEAGYDALLVVSVWSSRDVVIEGNTFNRVGNISEEYLKYIDNAVKELKNA